MHPERIVQLLGEVPQVDNVGGEKPEQHQRLAPLGRVAPKHPDVLDQQRANVPRHTGDQADDAFDDARRAVKVSLACLQGAEPGPLPEDAAATLDGGCGVVEEVAHAGESEAAEEQGVAQQHQPEESGTAQRPFRPAQHARGKPIAGQQRELREPRFHQQPVEHRQHAGLEHFVSDWLGLKPERHADEGQNCQTDRRHLKRAPVQETAWR